MILFQVYFFLTNFFFFSIYTVATFNVNAQLYSADVYDGIYSVIALVTNATKYSLVTIDIATSNATGM